MTTEKGIYYPTDYSDVADIPSDMKEMAESIDNALTSLDGEIEGIKEEQQTQNTQINNNKTDIEAIKTEQTEQNTDIQANTDNITALLEKIDYIEGLIPTDTATGESLTLSNTARYPFKEFNVGGNTKQQSYTGKNLLNVSENLSITRLKTVSISLPAGTYHLTCGTVSKGGTDDPHILIGSYHNAIVSNSNYTFTISSNVTSISIYSNGYSYDASGGITSTINQLMISEAGGDYEPYVGGQASPNPSYPQEIENVSGEVEVKVENKNLITGLYYKSGSSLNFYFDKNNVNPSMIFSGIIDKTLNRVATIYIGGVGSTIRVASLITINANQKFNIPVALTQEQIEAIKNATNPYIQIYRNSSSSVDLSTSEYSEVQLEQGSTATSYEPHEEQTVIFPLAEGQVLH